LEEGDGGPDGVEVGVGVAEKNRTRWVGLRQARQMSATRRARRAEEPQGEFEGEVGLRGFAAVSAQKPESAGVAG
jgi:hypothetical protein